MPTTSESSHAAAVHLLSEWSAPSPDQDLLRGDYLTFLSQHPDGLYRRQRAGHITASALIVDPTRHMVLLTLHPLVGRWLQTGGHCETSDHDLAAAARREAVEEGGISEVTLDPDPLRLDRHLVRCRDDTGGEMRLQHLDVQFLARVPTDAVPSPSSESLDLRWWPWDALPEDTDDSVRDLVLAAHERLGPLFGPDTVP